MKSSTPEAHKYLTLVYQVDQGLTRLLWVGKERTLESFQGFFTVIGDQLAAHIGIGPQSDHSLAHSATS